MGHCQRLRVETQLEHFTQPASPENRRALLCVSAVGVVRIVSNSDFLPTDRFLKEIHPSLGSYHNF